MNGGVPKSHLDFSMGRSAPPQTGCYCDAVDTTMRWRLSTPSLNNPAAQRTMHAETISFAATAYNTLCENIACRSYNAHRPPRTVQGTRGSMNNVVSYHLS
jgi:hypothetical protein